MKSVLSLALLLVTEIVLAKGTDIFGSVLSFISQQTAAKRFRCDYMYNKDVDGHIKYQEIPANWNEARQRCHIEGTILASPLNKELKTLMVAMVNATSKAAVWTGIHSTFSNRDFASLEGVPLSQIPHEWRKGEFDNYTDLETCLMQLPDGTLADANCLKALPYFCFKKDNPNMAMNSCGTSDPEYTLTNVTNKCYKFHKDPRTWSKAYMTCMAEGGHLAIINSVNESVVLKSILDKEFQPALRQKTHFNHNDVFLGFQYWQQERNFFTIDGQTLDEAGFNKWNTSMPSNNVTHTCGAMTRKEGLLTNARCERLTTFICEKDPKALTCERNINNIINI